MSSPFFVHASDQLVSRRTTDSGDTGSSDSFDTDRDLIGTSAHSHGCSAIVTLPPEEVLRLTTSQDEGEHFDSSHYQNSNENYRRATPQTTSLTESSASQSPSVTLPTEQVLSLTMNGDSSHSSGLDVLDDYHTSTSSNPARSVVTLESKLAKKKKKFKQTKSSSSRDTPSRTKSSSSRDASSRTKSSSSRNTPSRTKSSSSRDTPSRTKSSSSKDRNEIKKAVRKEKKSVDAVVAAAIRNYGADEKADSPRKSSKKKKSSPKSSASHSRSRGDDASMATGTGSTKKKKRKQGKRKPPADEAQPSSGETQTPAAPIDDFDEENPLPPPLNEQVSSSSFSIDRAGAIAVFPSDSIHPTQRRSITDHQRISDNDNSRNNLFTNDNEATIERGSVSRAVRRLEDLDSTTMTYEEIPEPPESQVINATATYQSPQTPTMPPPVGSRSIAPSSALSRGSESNPGEALSSVTMPMSSLDSSADDGFLGGSLVTDAESGTVTAKAISSEDYYAEVRRQLEQEAVIAVDVIPLTEDGRPIDPRLNVRNGDKGDNDKYLKLKRSRLNIRNYIWIGSGIGLLAIIVVIFLIISTKSGDTSPPVVGAPAPQIDATDNTNNISDVVPDISNNNDENNSNQNEDTSNPDENTNFDDDMAEMMEMMSSETANFWRRQFASILPSEILVDLVSDKSYMTPQGKAFVFLVENVESLFIIDNMRVYSLSPEEESKASTIFALVTLYHSLNGPNWFVRNNWLDADVYICEWHGVNCKGDLLPKATIADAGTKSEREGDNQQQLPPGIENFDILRPGDVFSNGEDYRFQDDDFVDDIITTTNDDLFDNDIFNNGADDDGNEEDGDDTFYYGSRNNKIDDYLSDKIAIHSLDLKANGLSGSFPRELGMLSNIYDTIDLSVNEITGSIPTHLGSLSKLQNIILEKNKLESSLPTELGSMTCLKTFDISGNIEINGTFPDMLSNWGGIERLEIQNTKMEGLVSEAFCTMVYERASPRMELLFMSQFEWDGTFFFRASCPSPLDCPCCTQCCHQDISKNDVCGPILEIDYSEDD